MQRKAFTLVELLVILTVICTMFIGYLSRVDFATYKAKDAGVLTDYRSYSIALDTVFKEKEFISNRQLIYDFNRNLDQKMRFSYTSPHLSYIKNPYGFNYELIIGDGNIEIYSPNNKYISTLLCFAYAIDDFGANKQSYNGKVGDYNFVDADKKSYMHLTIRDFSNILLTDQSSIEDTGTLPEDTTQLLDSDIMQIAVNGSRALLLTRSGDVWGIGDNKLGLGSATNIESLTKLDISNVKKIVASYNSTMFLKNDGTVWATGSNSYGHFSTGQTDFQTKIVKSNVENVKDLFAGYETSFFLLEDESLWAAGRNNTYQYGNNTNTNQSNAVKLTLKDVAEVYSGDDFTIFKKKNNTVYYAGKNNITGILGSLSNIVSPRYMDIGDIKKLAVGQYHFVVLLNSGEVYTAGNNVRGQIGNGNTTTSNSLFKLNTSDIVDIGAACYNTLFIKSTGSISGFGVNNFGILGNNKQDLINTTEQHMQIDNVDKFVAGGDLVVIMKKDGTVWYTGKLGNKLNIVPKQLDVSPLTNYYTK